MRSVVLGTAGHVDHGKTALVEALTGVNTDRWAEERERGITIDLGFARFPTAADGPELSVVDVPGHEDFVKNMLAGATGVDLLLLVVAADEGPMPQTHEHLWIARFLGVERGVAALTKTDLVEPEWAELVSESTRETLEDVFGPNDWPIVPVSAATGEGIEELRAAIVSAAATTAQRRREDLFRLPIDRCFTVRGVGTVVTGTVWSGGVTAGDELDLLPDGRTVRVRGIQVHNEEVESASAGQRAALALPGVDHSEVERGDVLVVGSGWSATSILDAHVRLIPNARWPLEAWQRVRVHLGSAEVMGRIVLYDADVVHPGGTALVQMRLEKPLLARGGDPFVVRFYSPVTTIGGGRVLDPLARRRGHADEVALERLRSLRDGALPERIGALLGVGDGIDSGELALRVGATPGALTDTLEALQRRGDARRVGERWYAADRVESLRESILEALEVAHARDPGAEGVSLERLRGQLEAPVELVDATLADLVASGAVRVKGSLAALSRHRPHLEPEADRLAQRVRARIREAGLAPPSVGELTAVIEAAEDELNSVLRFLTNRGHVVPVGEDLYYDATTLVDAAERVERFLSERGAATPADLREVLPVSRKYLIPLLEHLDGTGLTRRTDRGRVLRRSE